MITLTAGEIALLVGGELHCDKDLLISKAPVFDSRLSTPGSFFLALQGEKQDGHEFVAEAYRLGAMFSLTSPCRPSRNPNESHLDCVSLRIAFMWFNPMLPTCPDVNKCDIICFLFFYC